MIIKHPPFFLEPGDQLEILDIGSEIPEVFDSVGSEEFSRMST